MNELSDDDKIINKLAIPFIKHAMFRVDYLEKLLSEKKINNVTIAGTNRGNTHYLGKGLAKDQWLRIYFKYYRNVNKAHEVFINALQILFNDLKIKYPDRIKFGWLPSRPVDKMNYNVWGANSKNWQKSDEHPVLLGDEQAKLMRFVGGHENPGVFGIITTPLKGQPPNVEVSDDALQSLLLRVRNIQQSNTSPSLPSSSQQMLMLFENISNLFPKKKNKNQSRDTKLLQTVNRTSSDIQTDSKRDLVKEFEKTTEITEKMDLAKRIYHKEILSDENITVIDKISLLYTKHIDRVFENVSYFISQGYFINVFKKDTEWLATFNAWVSNKNNSIIINICVCYIILDYLEDKLHRNKTENYDNWNKYMTINFTFTNKENFINLIDDLTKYESKNKKKTIQYGVIIYPSEIPITLEEEKEIKSYTDKDNLLFKEIIDKQIYTQKIYDNKKFQLAFEKATSLEQLEKGPLNFKFYKESILNPLFIKIEDFIDNHQSQSQQVKIIIHGDENNSYYIFKHINTIDWFIQNDFMSTWCEIIIELNNRFDSLKEKINTSNLKFSEEFTLQNITCHTIFIDICFKLIDYETYGLINGYNICLFEISAPPFIINYESSSIKKSLEITNRSQYTQNIKIHKLTLEKTQLEEEKIKLERDKTILEIEKIKEQIEQIEQLKKLEELNEQLKQTLKENVTLTGDNLKAKKELTEAKKELTEAQNAQAVQIKILQQELEEKETLLLGIRNDLYEAHEGQKKIVAQIKKAQKEAKEKEEEEEEEEKKEKELMSHLNSEADLWFAEIDQDKYAEIIDIQDYKNELDWEKKYLKKGKETEQKYFTYKNKFNQSKYYDEYLKYKLKYNQLKEKFN